MYIGPASRTPWAPLGWRGVNFALFSAHATGVDSASSDTPRVPMTAAPAAHRMHDEVWHGYVPQLRPGQCYGYRVYGRIPRTTAIASIRPSSCSIPMPGADRQDDGPRGLFGYPSGEVPDADLPRDRHNSAPYLPKCVVIDLSLPGSRTSRPDPVAPHPHL